MTTDGFTEYCGVSLKITLAFSALLPASTEFAILTNQVTTDQIYGAINGSFPLSNCEL